jgi:1-acyl-sn-glycerol-3-phosphate acyltransferase
VAHFGPAFTLPQLSRDEREGELKHYTDEIMCRIAALLPEQYRGFYKNFPRVKELLASTC